MRTKNVSEVAAKKTEVREFVSAQRAAKQKSVEVTMINKAWKHGELKGSLADVAEKEVLLILQRSLDKWTPEFVSVTKAAEIKGVAAPTIRAAWKRGEIAGKHLIKAKKPHLYISTSSLQAWSERTHYRGTNEQRENLPEGMITLPAALTLIESERGEALHKSAMYNAVNRKEIESGKGRYGVLVPQDAVLRWYDARQEKLSRRKGKETNVEKVGETFG